MGAFRDSGAGLSNFWKSRVQVRVRVRRNSTSKKLLKIFLFYFLYIFTIKIFLKNTLLYLDSQNKERRRQETHYYASEVGISTVLARFKADFGCFGRFGRRPIRPDMADMAQFWPNQLGSARIETESAWIREGKKKKKAQTRHRLAGNRVELGCGTLPAMSMLSSLTVKINK